MRGACGATTGSVKNCLSRESAKSAAGQPEIAGVEDGPEVAFKEEHCRPGTVVRVHRGHRHAHPGPQLNFQRTVERHFNHEGRADAEFEDLLSDFAVSGRGSDHCAGGLTSKSRVTGVQKIVPRFHEGERPTVWSACMCVKK